jgi:hypothetical protein
MGQKEELVKQDQKRNKNYPNNRINGFGIRGIKSELDGGGKKKRLDGC